MVNFVSRESVATLNRKLWKNCPWSSAGTSNLSPGSRSARMRKVREQWLTFVDPGVPVSELFGAQFNLVNKLNEAWVSCPIVSIVRGFNINIHDRLQIIIGRVIKPNKSLTRKRCTRNRRIKINKMESESPQQMHTASRKQSGQFWHEGN